MKNRIFDLFIVLIIAVSSSVLTYKFMEKNSEPKIALVDMFELAQSVDPKAENRKELINKMVEKTKEKARMLWSEGYIVMKSSEFIEAPEYYYVEVE